MTKDKQIEEMAKLLGDTWIIDLEGAPHCLSEVLMQCDIEHIAEQLYDADCRKQEWISVDERLPEKGFDDEGNPLDFIVWGKEYPHATTAYFNGVNFYFECDDGSEGIMSKITHWAPLPEAPKMRKEDEGK